MTSCNTTTVRSSSTRQTKKKCSKYTGIGIKKELAAAYSKACLRAREQNKGLLLLITRLSNGDMSVVRSWVIDI